VVEVDQVHGLENPEAEIQLFLISQFLFDMLRQSRFTVFRELRLYLGLKISLCTGPPREIFVSPKPVLHHGVGSVLVVKLEQFLFEFAQFYL
jgi:hypothetical protein